MDDEARSLNTAPLTRPVVPSLQRGVTGGAGDHPMIQMPFTVEIDGRHYRGNSLSLVLAEIVGLIDRNLEGQTRLMRLLFAFDGFTISLNLECGIELIDPAAGRATLTFRDPTGPHLPQLRHILNSFIAGDLVSLGQTLGVAAVQKTPGGKNAAPNARPGSAISRLFGTLAVAVMSLALVVAVSAIVFQRLFSSPIASPAQVVIEGQSLNAVAAGQIDYINADAAVGEVAFSIRATTGQMLSIAMPCDCDATAAGPAVGSTVLAGEPVLQLSQPGAALVLTASIPREDLFKLSRADHVTASFADGTTVTTSVDQASLALAARGAAAGQPEVPFRLVPQTPLSAARQGQLAELVIVNPSPALLSPFARIIEAISFF